MRKIKYHKLLLAMLVLYLFSSCITSEETNVLQSLEGKYPKVEYKEYRLTKGDEIECVIYSKNEDFSKMFNGVVRSSGESSMLQYSGSSSATEGAKEEYLDRKNVYSIHQNGAVLLPFFGEINVAGHTLQEAEDIIQKEIQGSITDAYVKLRMFNNSFYVLADKGAKGKFEIYKENMTIYQAISLSGQKDRALDMSSVQVLRKNPDGTTSARQFDLRSNEVVQSEYYYVQPNDVYYFPTNKKSFFNITSLSSFFSTVMAPLSFLIVISKVKFD